MRYEVLEKGVRERFGTLGKGRGEKGRTLSIRVMKGRQVCWDRVIAREAQVVETMAPIGRRYGDEGGDGRPVY